MRKKTVKKLALAKDTLLALTDRQLAGVPGAGPTPRCPPTGRSQCKPPITECFTC